MPGGAERSVLHVLPHPGGGGETYVDLLEGMPGYRFRRAYLAPSSRPSALELARGLAVVVRGVRGHELLHVHGEVAAGLCLPLLASRRSVVTLHGLHFVRRVSGARRTAAALSLRAVLRAADRTICVSETEREELLRAVGSAAARRAVVVRNGVHLPAPMTADERAAVRGSFGISPSDTVAIWVGSLDERKDPLTAVRAAEAAAVTLLVVGDGPLRHEVERTASDHTQVLGQRADVDRLLAAADLFLTTSRREGLSFSLLEAMAQGLVPVVTDLPENREAIGDAGIAAPMDDHRALGRALDRAATDTTERVMLAERARERVAKLFDAAAMADRTRTVYDALS